MNFNFNATAGSSQSTSKPRLKGNDIYTVKFDECEVKDITGVNFHCTKNLMVVKQNGGYNAMMIFCTMMKQKLGQVTTVIIHTIQIQHILHQSKH